MITKLSIVNSCLRVAGLPPVSSLTEGALSTSQPLDVLERCTDLVQLCERIRVCSYENVEFTPDIDGHIQLPADILRLSDAYSSKYFVSDGLLFDYTENTNEFTDKVTLSYSVRLPFESLPLHVQMFLAIKVPRIYIDQRNNTTTPPTADELRALAGMRAIEREAWGTSLQLNPYVAAVNSRSVGPFRR